MAMFDCQRCGYAHHTDDFCESLLPPEPKPRNPAFPTGWLVKNDDGGWGWVGHRIAAVAAKTEGREVFNLAMGKWA